MKTKKQNIHSLNCRIASSVFLPNSGFIVRAMQDIPWFRAAEWKSTISSAAAEA